MLKTQKSLLLTGLAAASFGIGNANALPPGMGSPSSPENIAKYSRSGGSSKERSADLHTNSNLTPKTGDTVTDFMKSMKFHSHDTIAVKSVAVAKLLGLMSLSLVAMGGFAAGMQYALGKLE